MLYRDGMVHISRSIVADLGIVRVYTFIGVVVVVIVVAHLVKYICFGFFCLRRQKENLRDEMGGG